MRLEHASDATSGADGGHNEGGELHDDAENVHEERLEREKSSASTHHNQRDGVAFEDVLQHGDERRAGRSVEEEKQ